MKQPVEQILISVGMVVIFRQSFVRSCEATSFAQLAAARLFVSHGPDRNLDFYRLK